VWADSAYRSEECEARLKEQGYKSRVHRRGARDHPLSQRQQAANTTRSRIRVRVEQVFADQANSMGGKFVRTIGIARARVKICMMNLVYPYNMRRFVWLEQTTAAPA
jgi:transposase, IS5 family